MDQVRESVHPWARECGIALTDSMDPALPRLLRTDPDRLRQILTSLLGAAVSQARSEVFCKLDLDGGNLRALISSNGPVFPEAALQTVFEPFDNSVATRRRGGRSLTPSRGYGGKRQMECRALPSIPRVQRAAEDTRQLGRERQRHPRPMTLTPGGRGGSPGSPGDGCSTAGDGQPLSDPDSRINICNCFRCHLEMWRK